MTPQRYYLTCLLTYLLLTYRRFLLSGIQADKLTGMVFDSWLSFGALWVVSVCLFVFACVLECVLACRISDRRFWFIWCTRVCVYMVCVSMSMKAKNYGCVYKLWEMSLVTFWVFYRIILVKISRAQYLLVYCIVALLHCCDFHILSSFGIYFLILHTASALSKSWVEALLAFFIRAILYEGLNLLWNFSKNYKEFEIWLWQLLWRKLWPREAF